jgi:hypothetical protein
MNYNILLEDYRQAIKLQVDQCFKIDQKIYYTLMIFGILINIMQEKINLILPLFKLSNLLYIDLKQTLYIIIFILIILLFIISIVTLKLINISQSVNYNHIEHLNEECKEKSVNFNKIYLKTIQELINKNNVEINKKTNYFNFINNIILIILILSLIVLFF